MNATPPALALGTVQWGMSYGIANQGGRASVDDVRRMVSMAEAAGVATLDTARAYGEAESIIGSVLAGAHAWRVVTKTDPAIHADGDDAATVAAATRRSLDASCSALCLDTIDTVLLHRPDHRTAADGAAWHTLKAARDAGRIRAIGVSATSPATAMAALEDPDVQVMQVADNLLDRRLAAHGFWDAAAARGVEVHVRSIHLQGVAFMPIDSLPPHLQSLASPLGTIEQWAHARGVTSAAVFLAYALSLRASRAVIGCERAEQLEWNLAAARSAADLQAELGSLAASLPPLAPDVLDPGCWPAPS